MSPQDLYSPDDEESWEAVEGEAAISEDEEDLEEIDNWEFPASGNITLSQNAPQAQAPPLASNSASTSKEDPIDSELFQMYGLPINWNLAPELINWLRSVTNREVPYSVLKPLMKHLSPKRTFSPFSQLQIFLWQYQDFFIMHLSLYPEVQRF